MFQNLEGRQVVISTNFGEGFRGTIESVGDTHLRLRDFEVVVPTPAGDRDFLPAQGIARVLLNSITWIQEL